MKQNRALLRETEPSLNLKSQSIAFLRDMAYVFVAVLIVNSFVMASFEVPTGSMEDTVKIGDRLIVNKFIYGGSTPYTIPFTSTRLPHFRVPGFRKIARGDVVVFDWPGSRDQIEKPQQVWYLKRCIGLPGDTVRVGRRIVYVNDKVFQNPVHIRFMRDNPEPAGYGNPDIFPRGTDFNEDNYGPIIVPQKGMALILNARTFPAWRVFICREGHTASLINGKLIIDGRKTSYYVVNRDYIFAMGDNRDNSLDSRFWGFVPMDDVVGTPIFVYWSWNPQIPFYDLFDKIRSIDLRRIGTIIR